MASTRTNSDRSIAARPTRHARTTDQTRGARGGRRGFTLIELVAVMVIVGILAGVSVPAFNSVSDTRQVAATRRVQADLAWARQYAVATGRRTWVVFDEVAESWSLLAELPSNPGRANAVALSDPGTGGTWTGAADGNGLFDVEIITAEFDGADEIGFDWIGRPLNAAETDLAAEGVVTLTGGHQVTVAAESGLVRFVP